MSETENLKLPKIAGNMAADVVRDLNALAEAIDAKAGAVDGLARLGPDGKLPAEQLDFDTSDLASKVDLQTHIDDADKHVSLAEKAAWNAAQAKVNAHAELRNNPHGVTKSQVGLGDVDNVQQASKEDFDAHMEDDTAHGIGDKSQLETSEKGTIVGAINEVFQAGNSRKSELVDRLLSLDDSLPIANSDSWDDVLNAIQIIDIGLVIEPGEILIHSNDTDKTTTNRSMEKIKEIKVNIAGTYRVKFYLQNVSSGTTNARIYVNGDAIGILRTLSGSNDATTFTEDISLVRGDLIQVYAETTLNSLRIREFRLHSDVFVFENTIE